MKRITNTIKIIFLILCISFCLLSPKTYSQTLVAAEYFFNTDPGLGNGTPFTIPNTDSINISITIPTTGLSSGFNHLFIRVKDSNGKWSHYDGRTLLVKPPLPTIAPLYTGEYFFDTDPGVGNATSFSFTAGNDISISVPVNTSGLSAGIHALYFRVRDLTGKWSLYENGIILVKDQIPIPNHKLLYGEYFFDADTGGVGTVYPFTFPLSDSVNTTMNISTSGLSPGVHYINFRYRDSAGIYGLFAGQYFRLCDIAAIADFSADTVCLGQDSTTFINLSINGDTATKYIWDFNGDGINDRQTQGLFGPNNPISFKYKYTSGGIFQCRLVTDNGGGCSDTTILPVLVIAYPSPPTPTGSSNLCINSPNSIYTIPAQAGATSYEWILTPINAGTLTYTDTSATIDWNDTWTGTAQLKVRALYGVCTSEESAPFSSNKNVLISPQSVSGSLTLAQSSICEGSSTGNITLSGHVGNQISWQKRKNGANWIDIPFGGTIYSETPLSSGIWDYRAIVKNYACDSAFTSYVTITVLPKPTAAGLITGSMTVCEGQYQVSYSVQPITGATHYEWTVPFGATIISGTGTNSILVNYNMGATSGVIQVFGSNNCGLGATSPPLPINVNVAPVANAGSDLLVFHGTSDTLSGSAYGGLPPYTYSWSPTSLLINPNLQNAITEPMLNSTPFTLTVTDSLGCIGTDQVNVIVYGQPLNCIAVADPIIVCQGSSCNLNAVASGGTGTYTYTWASNPPGFTSSIQNPVATPTATTQYIVTVTNGTQTASNSITVTISPKPSAAGTITGPNAVCAGQTGVTFSVPIITNANGYIWSLPYGATIGSGANTNTIVVNFSDSALTGNITVIGTNNCGAGTISPNKSVIINPKPVANAGPQQNITNGLQTTLQGSATGGSGSYSFLWSPASMLNTSPNIHSPQTVPLVNSITYSLTVTDNQTGCSGTSSVLILVIGFPLSATTSAVPGTICQGETSQITALPNGGSGNYTYEWSSNPPGFTSTDQNPVVSPSVTTEYIVTVTAGVQTATANVIVTVSPIPAQPGLITGNDTVCKGDNYVTYTVPVVTGANVYHWQFPNGTSVYSGYGTNSITVNYTLNAVSGNISVYASNFCGTGPVSNPIAVFVNSLPSASAGNDTVISIGGSVTLQGSAWGGSGNYSYAWSPALLFNSSTTIPNPTTAALANSQIFTLSVTDNETGCIKTSQVQVIVSGGPLTAIATAANTTICEGSSTQLNALPQGGTGTYTYYWTSNPPGFTSTLKNPTVTPDTLVTEYTVLVEDGFDQAFSTIVITLSPLPVAPGLITGDTVVCQGETGVLYSVSPVPNSSGYFWTLPTGCILASGSNTSTITANYSLQSSSGIMTVAATNYCGIGPTSPSLPIQVNTLPLVDAGQNIFINQNSTTQLVGNVSGGSGNYTYAWTPMNYLVNPNILNPTTYPMSNSVLFTFKATDTATGCYNTDMVQVIVTGLSLSVGATADPQVICQGGQSTLFALPTGGTGSYTYLWTSSPPGLNSVLQNPVVSPTTTTQYNVEINDGTTTANSLITVTVNDLPSAAGQISGPTAICKGASNVSFSVPLIPGATSYVWQLPSGGTISSGANTNSITANFTITASTGLISVYGVNACGNGPSSSYQLTLNPLPTASAGSDMFINNGTDTILYGSATGGFGVYNYLWAPSILLINDTLQQCTTLALNNPTTFYLTVTDVATGCKGTDDVTVYIMGGALTAAATASPTNICQGQTSQLNAIPTGGSGNYSYSWSSTPSGLSSIIQNPIVTPSVSTTYSVTVTSGVNTATASVVVTVNPLPSTPGTISGTNTVCQGASSIIYTVAPVNGASSYNWTLPPGATIIGGQGTNSIAVYFASNAVSGNINVNGTNLCGSGPSSSNYLVTVNPSPVVDAGNDQYVFGVGNSANLNGIVSGGIGPFAYQWSPLMFFSPQSNANFLNTTTVGLYSSATLTLTVLDSTTGCTSFDQMNIIMQGGALSLSANSNQTNICQGQSAQLNALPSGGTGNYTYYWTSFPAGPTYTIQNPTVSPTVTTQYLATVYDGIDSASFSVVINVSPQPSAAGNIIGSSLVCQGDNAVMFTVASIANATSYIWNLPPSGFTISSGNGTNTIFVDIDNNATSGSIFVYGTNGCGLGSQSPYFDVNVNLTPFAYTSADQYIPQNSSTQMFGHAVGGSGSYTYTWEPSNLVQTNNVQNPYTVNLSQSNVYILTVYDNFTGCQSSDIIQIIVYGGPLSVAVSSNIYNICGGQSVQLNALPTGGNGQYTFSWTPNTYINNATIYNPVATPNVTTEYTVEVVSGGLTATNSLLITVYPQAGNAGTITGSSSVCQGETGVLFSVPPISNATNYYWTVPYGATIVSGGNTNNIMVNFSNNATSGNISVYGGNVCGFGNASQNFWLNVNPIPTVSAGSDQQIVSGINTTLHGLASGGSGGYDYLWTPENLLLDSSVLNPITIALTSSHIFTLYVTDTVSGCVSSDYMKVIVCGGPLSVDALVNNNNICYGQTVQLDALPSGGNCVNGTYNWSSIPSGFSSSLVNPVASPTVTTTYIVDYNDGDNIATSSVVVTVNPLVDDAGQIQGPGSVCQNSGTITYSVPPITGATHYIWTFPQGTIILSNPDSNVVEVLFTDTAQSGFISVYATSFCGIGGSSLPYPVVVKPLPGPAGYITGPTYMSKNNIAQFTVPAIPGTYYYYWVLPYGAVILSGEGTNSITVEFTDDSKSGFIYVYGMNSCGTGDPSYDHLLTIITSIAELYDIQLKLYPNPNKGEFTLEIQATEEEKYQMKVLNLFGSEVYSTEIYKAKNNLDMSHLPNGMYYLVLRNEKVKIIERFVIVK